MEVTEALKKEVWNRGRQVEGYDGNMVRKDACDAFMIYSDYGKADSIYGWQIDHVCPVAFLAKLGYTEDQINNIENLRPMNWRNNISKSDDYPSYTSAITSDGDLNVEKEESKIVNVLRRNKLEQLYPLIKS